MYKQPIILKAPLDANLKRHILFRGSLIGMMGATILLLSGVFIPQFWLAYLGLPLFLLGGSLIWLGLRPYRQLSRLELNPNEIHIAEGRFSFYSANKLQFSIPMADIQKIDFIKSASDRCLVIQVKESSFPHILQKHLIHSLFFTSPYKFIAPHTVCIPYMSEKLFKNLSVYFNYS